MSVWTKARSLTLIAMLLALGSASVRAHDNPTLAPLAVTLTTNKSFYAAGESVLMTMTVRNLSTRPVTLHFHTSQVYDFVVRDGFSGREVWKWSRDKAFEQVLMQRELAPGAAWVIREEWNQQDNSGQPVPQGFYTLQGVVTSHPRYLSNLTGFWIAGRRS